MIETNTPTRIDVTLSAELLTRLRGESRRLEIPLEYLVAGLVLDTIDETQGVPVAG